jgi:isopentenyl diphosphate isomerase/L-lactate dehydrogenase-like FMN-dependent dehydrogenase
MNDLDRMESRRRFLKFLAASPFAAYWLGSGSLEERIVSAFQTPSAASIDEPALHKLITSADQALNVFDLEAVAKQNLPPAHWGYMATGVDDDVTLRANRSALSKIQIRPRRLVDVTKFDASTEILGVKWKSPILISPVGTQRAFHKEGEVATAKAAASRGHLQILSTVASTSVEDVTAARGGPVWYQLYATAKWDITQALIKRAEAAGCPVLVVTVDLPAGRNTETLNRFRRVDSRTCTDCHEPGPRSRFNRRPMLDGLDSTGLTDYYSPNLTWDSIRRMKDMTKMKIVLKGIVTREDAELCAERGVDGIIVSNHGGRAEESGRSTIECLPEVVDAVRGKIPVLVDGGFRRGTDIFKALALGAKAVGIGRPYIWGLSAFGQAGVEKVLDILRGEFTLVMRQAGVTSLDQIKRSYVTEAWR